MRPAEDDSRQLRAARNEVFFREANELVEREGVERGSYSRQFICECSVTGCLERITLTIEEYERVHSNSAWFMVVPGHEDPSVESVVEDHERYLVVEKHGPAGDEARAHP